MHLSCIISNNNFVISCMIYLYLKQIAKLKDFFSEIEKISYDINWIWTFYTFHKLNKAKSFIPYFPHESSCVI